jgi:hypothetical protein
MYAWIYIRDVEYNGREYCSGIVLCRRDGAFAQVGKARHVRSCLGRITDASHFGSSCRAASHSLRIPLTNPTLALGTAIAKGVKMVREDLITSAVSVALRT